MYKNEKQEHILKYTQNKFKSGRLVYLTDSAHSVLKDEVGPEFYRGPYLVTNIGEAGGDAYLNLRNPTEPSWAMSSFIEMDAAIEDRLTEDEYHIQQLRKESGKEKQTLNWVPEIDKTVHVLCNAYEDLKPTHAGKAFSKCVVESVLYNEFDIRGLPKISVRQWHTQIKVRGICPLMTY